MKLTTSKEANINYLAKIVKLEDHNFRPHPNADRLQLVHLCGNIISTTIDAKPGYYVYFPVECVICPKFLKFHNLYRDANLNANPEETGFFEESGRVKCIKLRGIASEGFIIPYVDFYIFAVQHSVNSADLLAIYEEAESLVNTSFDTVDDRKLVWKYVIKTVTPGVNLNGRTKNTNNTASKIVDNQFRFHIDTPKLQDNIYKLDPSDIIQISIKQHGTSAIFCNLLTKRELSWKEKLAQKLHIPVVDSEYTVFCASRKVIKDRVLNPNVTQGYYDCDIWNLALDVVKDYIPKGMTIYAEIVGFMPTGSRIQGDWDYKCIYDPNIYNYKDMSARAMYDAKLFDIIVYRITTTNVDGKVHEYSTQQVIEWCVTNGLHHVTELYYGYAKDLFDLDPTQHWNENFIDALREAYLEGDSVLCNNKVPEEGIVLRREVSNIDVYKLKSNRFLQKETKELDKGVIDIESAQ